MQFKWNYEPPTSERLQAADELAEKIGMSPTLATLLIQRGIKTESAAKRFFRPMLNELIDPFLMNDMDVAVDRLNDAMGRKERIMVYGDYDVDGCTAVALVYKFLQQFYSNMEYYIPDRYEEGYGVSHKGIDYAAETGVKLIIVLDCGIKAIEEIAYAKQLGIDFIICDHHVPDEVMPPAVAILNPKREDSTYPFKHLSGCGVGFKLMQAFAKNNGIPFSRLIPLLDFCALSIAADLVPIEGENRTLAFHGLKQLNQSPSIGLKAIIEICGLTGRELTMSSIRPDVCSIARSAQLRITPDFTDSSSKHLCLVRQSLTHSLIYFLQSVKMREVINHRRVIVRLCHTMLFQNSIKIFRLVEFHITIPVLLCHCLCKMEVIEKIFHFIRLDILLGDFRLTCCNKQ